MVWVCFKTFCLVLLVWIFSMTGYVCVVFMNVNLSMCKQTVFKHGRACMSKNNIKGISFYVQNACLCESNDMNKFCVAVCINLNI